MDVDAAVFDVFGTMTDWRSSVTAELADIGGRAGLDADWPAVADAWRRRYRPVLERVLGGELPWRPLDDLHRLMLDDVVTEYGLEGLGEAERDALVQAWHHLRPWPDAAAGLEKLHHTRVITATLSNGGVGQLAGLTKQAGLRFDCILSAELARSYKPDLRVYRMAAELLEVEPRRPHGGLPPRRPRSRRRGRAAHRLYPTSAGVGAGRRAGRPTRWGRPRRRRCDRPGPCTGSDGLT